MKSRVIVDTGPLVALLSRSETHHAWVMQQLGDIQPTMLTCEAVLAEATYLTRAGPGAHAAILLLICRYTNVPMSLADACLVRLAEL